MTSADAGAAAGLREARLADAAELGRLLTQLEHPTSADDVIRQWPAFVASGNVALVIARDDGTLAGVAVMHRMHTLHRHAPVGRISALVVDAPDRGRGVGRALVRAAEARLREAGCGLMEITSHVLRVEAHGFYDHLGYELTSHRFAKAL
jgi:GNAT superfamily N-acetyltransferase